MSRLVSSQLISESKSESKSESVSYHVSSRLVSSHLGFYWRARTRARARVCLASSLLVFQEKAKARARARACLVTSRFISSRLRSKSKSDSQKCSGRKNVAHVRIDDFCEPHFPTYLPDLQSKALQNKYRLTIVHSPEKAPKSFFRSERERGPRPAASLNQAYEAECVLSAGSS